jgi:hypothetical protein
MYMHRSYDERDEKPDGARPRMNWYNRMIARIATWRARPRVGQWIYVPGSYYLSHGQDDFDGGRCKIAKVIAANLNGSFGYTVEIEEQPGVGYNWSGYLEPQQEKLRARFGEQRGQSNPDRRPEFNKD